MRRMVVSERPAPYGTRNRVKQRMTEEEFVAWVFGGEHIRAEWVNGEVIVMPPENYEHLDLGLFLCELFRRFVRRRKLGVVLFEQFQIRVPQIPSRRQPDILFVSHERRAIIKKTYVEGPPDLALEVISPESTERDYTDKFAEYALAGIRELWYVDPQTRALSAHKLNAKGEYERIVERRGKVASRVLPGFFLRGEWIWSYEKLDPDELLKEMGVN